jgi:hypothetical protein
MAGWRRSWSLTDEAVLAFGKVLARAAEHGEHYREPHRGMMRRVPDFLLSLNNMDYRTSSGLMMEPRGNTKSRRKILR